MAKKKQKKQNGGGQKFLSDEQYVRQRVRSLELGTCYMDDSLFKSGEGSVIVTRKHTGGRISAAFFLTDVWCTGVKDSFCKLRLEDFELEEMIEECNAFPCSYEEAHNIVYGAVEFASEAGIEPCKDFSLTRYFLEEDTEEIPLIDFDFGRNGKHFLVAYSKLEASKYLPLLRKNLGEDGFEYAIEGDEFLNEDSEPYDNLFTVKETLQDINKESLLKIAHLLNITLDENMSDDEMREKYCKDVFANLEQLMDYLSLDDYVVLLDMKNGYYPGKGTPVLEFYQPTLLELFGLAISVHDKYGNKIVYLATDFAEKILPLVNRKVFEKQSVVRMIEVYVSGLANLYGEVSVTEIVEFLGKMDEYGDEAFEIFNHAFDYSPLLKLMYYYDDKSELPESEDNLDNRIFFMSRMKWYDFEKMHAMLREVNRKQVSRKEFTHKEVNEIGTIIRLVVPNKNQGDFKRYLTSLGFADFEIDDLCFKLWFFAMHEGDKESHNVSPQAYFEQKMKYIVELEEIEHFSMDEALKHLEDYMENMPRWFLRGYSSKEYQSL